MGGIMYDCYYNPLPVIVVQAVKEKFCRGNMWLKIRRDVTQKMYCSAFNTCFYSSDSG